MISCIVHSLLPTFLPVLEPPRVEPAGIYCSDGKRPDGIGREGNHWCEVPHVWTLLLHCISPMQSVKHRICGNPSRGQEENHQHTDYPHIFTPVSVETSELFGPLTCFPGRCWSLYHPGNIIITQATGEKMYYSFLLQRLPWWLRAVSVGTTGQFVGLDQSAGLTLFIYLLFSFSIAL